MLMLCFGQYILLFFTFEYFFHSFIAHFNIELAACCVNLFFLVICLSMCYSLDFFESKCLRSKPESIITLLQQVPITPFSYIPPRRNPTLFNPATHTHTHTPTHTHSSGFRGAGVRALPLPQRFDPLPTQRVTPLNYFKKSVLDD